MRHLLVPSAALGALVLAGCSQQMLDDLVPGDKPGASSRPTISAAGPKTGGRPESTGASPKPSTSARSGTADLEPCDMLTTAEQTTLKLQGGDYDEVGPARGCFWQVSGSHSTSVAIIDKYGLALVQSRGKKTATTIGTHDAIQYSGPLDTCAFALEVTGTSRVDVMATAGSDFAKACGIAKRTARLVEPKLP